MKKFIYSLSYTIISGWILLGCLACVRTEIAPTDLTGEVYKIENAYSTANSKIEMGGTPEKESFATGKMQSEVKEQIEAYRTLFETRYKVSRNMWEGFPVGVIPANDACPAGSEKIRFKMDNQDNGNSSKLGWTGSWFVDGNGNSWHTLCSVNGSAFRVMTMNTSTQYLVVRLGNNKTIYMEPRVWNVYIDNEDKNNQNELAEGDLSPGHISKNGTHLQFWAIAGKNTPGVSQAIEFPDFGFSYGVLGTFSSPVIGGAAGIGTLRTDDENSNNANQLFSVDLASNVSTPANAVAGNGVDRTNDPGNTTFNIRRVR